jgi:8-oxo-dGTP pyrophosphatase MutT (NUDIX family)
MERSDEDSDGQFRTWCRQVLCEFESRRPGEAGRLNELRQLLGQNVDLRSRRTRPGHLTASALVFSADMRSILLIQHRSLGRWLQPGGHLEAGEMPLDAAKREVQEEAGLDGLRLLPIVEDRPWLPLDIDSHAIAANPAKAEPAHVHHDFRYAMIVCGGHFDRLRLLETEVSAADWVPIDGAASERLPDSLKRGLRWILDERQQ